MNRRAFLKQALALLACPPRLRAFAAPRDPSNFRAVYLDPDARDRFFLFLQNVYHLYPEGRFHQLIIDLAARYETDEQIYRALLDRLPEIKPTLGELTYAVPALRKQKAEMARQSAALLGDRSSIDGYLEIGSTGRYVSGLSRRLPLDGRVWVLNDVAPSYAPADILERGDVAKIGAFVPMGNYDPFVGSPIPECSLDLVTNFIGFHHCPAERLDGFVRSIHGVLRTGGRLLLRDHDVDGPGMASMVALAHDVFNAGLFLPWETNHGQVRRFRSVAEWSRYLTGMGFERSPGVLAQAHDPTRNLLVEFMKV